MNLNSKIESLLESLGVERRIHYALDRMQAALSALGNPEKSVQTVIVAGTNGKGATTLFISAALKEAGYRVGSYLSPHLQSPTERILLNLNPIPESEMLDLAIKYLPHAQKYQLSYFEFLTLLYFIYINEAGCEYSVLEVGLGGRLDATNVTDPIASVLTSISFDHQSYLGNTLSAILNEKLGIMRPGVPLYTSIRDTELRKQVEETCKRLGSRLSYSDDFENTEITLTNPSPSARENAALAWLTIRRTFPSIPKEVIARAFSKVINPGRMELMQIAPEVYLSGDHNQAGIESLLQTLKQLKPRKLLTLCAFSPDKPFNEMYSALKAVSDEILLTKISKLREALPTNYDSLGSCISDPTTALNQLLAKAGPEDRILVTGSLYLVGELRGHWKSCVSFSK